MKISGNKNGIAALPVILLLAGIILEIVAVGGFVAFSFSTGSYGTMLSTESLFGARTGIDDAAYRIIRNNYPPSGKYSINVVAGTHEVTDDIEIYKDPSDLGTCAVTWGCRYRVISTGKALFRSRKFEAIFSVDPQTREIRRDSLREIEL